MEIISAAGNTEVPAYLTLQELGLQVSRQILKNGDEEWTAENAEIRYCASSSLELLGIHALRQNRGSYWQATDEAIADYLAIYHSEART